MLAQVSTYLTTILDKKLRFAILFLSIQMAV